MGDKGGLLRGDKGDSNIISYGFVDLGVMCYNKHVVGAVVASHLKGQKPVASNRLNIKPCESLN